MSGQFTEVVRVERFDQNLAFYSRSFNLVKQAVDFGACLVLTGARVLLNLGLRRHMPVYIQLYTLETNAQTGIVDWLESLRESVWCSRPLTTARHDDVIAGNWEIVNKPLGKCSERMQHGAVTAQRKLLRCGKFSETLSFYRNVLCFSILPVGSETTICMRFELLFELFTSFSLCLLPTLAYCLRGSVY